MYLSPYYRSSTNKFIEPIRNNKRVSETQQLIQRLSRLIEIMNYHQKHQPQPKVVMMIPRQKKQGRKPLMAILLCLFGLGWQLFTLVSEFVRYDMVSEVFITKDDHVKPPAMSICFLYTQVIDWSQTEEKNTSKQHPGFTKLVQQKYTVKWILEKTYNIEKLLYDSWIRKENSYGFIEGPDLPPQIIVTKYLKDFYVCYRFMHVKAEQEKFYFRAHHISYGRRPGKLMALRFYKSDFKGISRAVIYLHDPKAYPRGDRDYPLILISNRYDVFDTDHTYYGITYTKTVLHLLPSPYATKCINYKKEYGYENQIHCQHKCVTKMAMEQFNRSIFTVTSVKGEENNHSTLSKYSIVNNDRKEAEIDKIIDYCNESSSGLDCERIYFIPQVIATREDHKFVVFEMYDMNGPQYIAWSHKKLPIISFMISTFSIIGIWMGLSCKDLIVGAFSIMKQKR